MTTGRTTSFHSFETAADGTVQAVWNTPYMANGVYQLQIRAQVTQDMLVLGSTVSVTLDNTIWFPDFISDCGDAMRIDARSKHVNGTWEMFIYNDQDPNNPIADLGGAIDANGQLTLVADTDPEPGWSLSLLDSNGNQLPSTYYVLAISTFAAAGAQGQAAANSPASSIAFKNVEPRWNFSTKFAVAYQQVFAQYSAGASALTTEMQALFAICDARNSPGVVRGNAQVPFEVITLSDWGYLGLDLEIPNVRNFLWLGHGAADAIGSKYPNIIGISRLNDTILKNDNNGNAYGGPNLHPYRFVFLDGCQTATGKMSDAFGIPSKENMPAKTFTDQGMRFRTYLGWKTLASLGTLSTLNVIHTTFTTQILNKWADSSGGGPALTVKQAFDAAEAIANLGSPWSGADDLAIYGYWGLLWQDTIP